MIPTRWKQVSAEEAAASPYYGFGGLLIFFYVIALILIALPVMSVFGSGEGTMRMYGPENAAVMRNGNAVRLLLLLPFLVLAPLKHRLMPAIAIACYWASLAVLLITFATANVPMGRMINVILFNAAVAIVFTLYLLFSKRVNATYRQRVPADG